MKKKYVILIIIVMILIILITPRIDILKDGGTKIYKSLTYKITKIHELNQDYENSYKEGFKIEIFGLTIYENIKSKKIDSKELIIYSTEDGKPHDPYTLCCKTDKIYKKIKVETENARVLNVSPNYKYILISDGNIKIYNDETDELLTTNLIDDYEMYILQTIGENDKPIGISFYKYNDYFYYNSAGFYNIETKEKLYENTYSVINIIDENTLIAVKKEQEEKYILSATEEKIIKKEENSLDESKGTIE